MTRLRFVVFLFSFFLISASYAVGPVVQATAAKPAAAPGVSYEFYKKLPAPPKTINVISGVPLNSPDDPTGGFGDVVANLFAAQELKKRDPELTVNFIITTIHEWPNSVRTRSDVIIHKLVPETDPMLVDVVQSVRGINYIFLSDDVFGLPKHTFMDANYLSEHPELTRKIPASDLALQYSANRTAITPVLDANSAMQITFTELYGPNSLFNDGKARLATAGFENSGMYLVRGLDKPSLQRQNKINSWLQQKGKASVDFQNQELAVAYTSNPISTEIYLLALDKLAAQNPSRKFHVVVRDQAKLPAVSSENLEVTTYASMPSDVMEALIAESTVSPLVRGDLSFSTAISSVRPHKAFINEVSSWKMKSAQSLNTILHREGCDEEKLNLLMLSPSAFSVDDFAKKDNHATQLAQVLTDYPFLEQVRSALVKNYSAFDIITNTYRIFQYKTFFKNEIEMMGAQSPAMRIYESLWLRSRNFEQAFARAREGLETNPELDEKLDNLLFLFKFEQPVNPELLALGVLAFAHMPEYKMEFFKKFILSNPTNEHVLDFLRQLMVDKNPQARERSRALAKQLLEDASGLSGKVKSHLQEPLRGGHKDSVSRPGNTPLRCEAGLI